MRRHAFRCRRMSPDDVDAVSTALARWAACLSKGARSLRRPVRFLGVGLLGSLTSTPSGQAIFRLAVREDPAHSIATRAGIAVAPRNTAAYTPTHAPLPVMRRRVSGQGGTRIPEVIRARPILRGRGASSAPAQAGHRVRLGQAPLPRAYGQHGKGRERKRSFHWVVSFDHLDVYARRLASCIHPTRGLANGSCHPDL